MNIFDESMLDKMDSLQLASLDLNTLAQLYEQTHSRRVLSYLFLGMHIQAHANQKTYSLDWVIGKVGTPRYYSGDQKNDVEVYYDFGDQLWGILRFNKGAFVMYTTVSDELFMIQEHSGVQPWPPVDQV